LRVQAAIVRRTLHVPIPSTVETSLCKPPVASNFSDSFLVRVQIDQRLVFERSHPDRTVCAIAPATSL
jgi:hypothetical protein